ncbi:hypothetical protein [Pseudosulfitobacter pseudonitzschiae]|uniref:hypothetical protein n=1 Tax=Pseudosulfitobacter pseudonitzschiae TaxID=1402135 RepID=UPI003B7689A1
MKSWPVTCRNTVFHVGKLDESASDIQSRASLEAYCLSVSENPEEWTKIARLGGLPCWKLTRKNSRFVDVHAFDGLQADYIRKWAIREGFATEEPLWRAWITDEDGDWAYMVQTSRHEAEREVEDYDIEPGDGPAPDGSCVEEVIDLVLTEKGMSALERWTDPTSGFDGALILFCRNVIAPDDRDIIGIWWDDCFDPPNLSCPRGGIFPDRLDEFDVSLDSGPQDIPGFSM